MAFFRLKAVLQTGSLPKLAKLNYGQAAGFTCHSFRHTFVARLRETTGNDVGSVMSLSGHRSIESFKIYLHPDTTGAAYSLTSIWTPLATCWPLLREFREPKDRERTVSM